MSILFLTTHKCASTFMNLEVLPILAEDQGLRRLDPGREAFRKADGSKADYGDHAADCDVLMGPVYIPDEIRDPAAFDSWTKILLLRDPRDAMVSFFFHAIRLEPKADGSHAERSAKRARVQKRGLDKHMRRTATAWRDRYRDYRRRIAKRPNTTLLRYEDMVADWPAFVRKLSDALPRPLSTASLVALDALGEQFDVQGENAGQHRRQVSAGDHRRKLQPETIAYLDEVLGRELDWLGHDHQ